MENFIKVHVDGEKTYEIAPGTTVLDLLKLETQERKYPVVAAIINNTLQDLRTEISEECEIRFVDLTSEHGIRVYHRSATMLLMRAIAEVLPGSTAIIQHSLGNGLYGEINYDKPLKDRDITRIERQMGYIIEADEPMVRKKVSKKDAERLFTEAGLVEKIDLLSYLPGEEVEIYCCGGFYDFYNGPLVPSTGYIKQFRLRFYLPGFILELPKKENPNEIPPYVEQGKLASVHFEAKKWAGIIKVNNALSLNHTVTCGNANNLIRVSEALHEKKIAQIADQITENIDRIRIVLIAGPSSSGKTTFAQRLSIQLQVNGICPVAISLDDYFVDREHTPRDADGNYDFESIDAIDRALFNEHLIKLIQGEEVELPYFNFKTGKREYHGNKLKLGPADLVVVEGIHGLNDILTSSIPKGRKFKIYVSALTQINLDNHNRIPTTDVRLLRRIARDHRCRGRSAKETLAMWPSVRRGEEKNIFPFQESADVMFNSALPYELAVLKKIVEPLLQEISPEHAEHVEAQRLLKFLSYFASLGIEDVPLNSIAREFVGGSCFPAAR
ncbi:phosphoribulokinase/uridine kinase [Desulfotomaculum nigrificans CO-1-SRB]|uniref:Phosphoribulokinase/uridine kinase n=1 Tax=Desulfotomaculum nigrificans (strain DSM 14880 / VKM B-2319 / CO-1-SRB) TaxID=868595 RepID=F6B3W7_DESCC|nr:nucleoside kinase [Desulfotomaculum nigrificans]AEF92932.1 phosphoribulokinase/uridine kinase [Desulfotomaculum nigrificans CO-1-SRB]